MVKYGSLAGGLKRQTMTLYTYPSQLCMSALQLQIIGNMLQLARLSKYSLNKADILWLVECF